MLNFFLFLLLSSSLPSFLSPSLFLLPSVSSFLHCFFSFCLLLFNHHEKSSQKSCEDLKSQPLRFFIIWSTFPMQAEQRMPPLHPSRMNTPLSFPLFPLTPSSPALTGCDHPCLHLLSALALFFILCLHCCTGLSPVSGGGGGHFSCGMWSSHCGRILYCRHDLSCSKACGIPLNQGSNSFLPHWQADSLPLSHQGRPLPGFFCPSQLSPHTLQGLIHVPFSMKSCLMTPANINLILSWLSLLLTLKSRIEIVAVLGPLSWRFLGYLWAKGLLVITMRMI